MNIKLNFINLTDDFKGNIVVFQKNVASDYNNVPIAWKVIENCEPYSNHPFIFPSGMTVSTSDDYGNYTPKLSATSGELFEMRLMSSGDRLILAGPATSPKEVQVVNCLPRGSINVNIYKDSGLLSNKVSIVPQQKAVFQFKPTIWIGATEQKIVQGTGINASILSQLNTELSLLGLESADIVMTGSKKTGYLFEYQNVVLGWIPQDHP